VEESRTVSTIATVVAIDHKSREVTIKAPHGDTFTFHAGDSVKNLDQVKVGDRIVVDYYESLAIQVVKPGPAGSGQETVVEKAEPGETPAGAAAEKTTFVATVESIDRAAPSITLATSDGKVATFRVRHPERLNLVKVGDTLRITFKEAVAVAVEPAAKSGSGY
jgi:hypothetical protein